MAGFGVSINGRFWVSTEAGTLVWKLLIGNTQALERFPFWMKDPELM